VLPRKYGLSAIIGTLSALILLGLATKPTPAAFLYWTNPLILEFVFGLAIAYAYEKGKTLEPVAKLWRTQFRNWLSIFRNRNGHVGP
jgi:hypothetical protein